MKSSKLEIGRQSPPFPLDSDNAEKVHARLCLLYDWLEANRPVVNKFVGKECVAPGKPPAPLVVHLNLPVPRLMQLMQAMGSIREAWDTIVRSHEESWGSDKMKDVLHTLLHAASSLLDGAYLSDEMREAKHHDLCGKALQARVLSMFTQQFGMPGGSDDPEEKKDED